MSAERPLETGQNPITPAVQGEVDNALEKARQNLAKLEQDYKQKPENYPVPPIGGGSPAVDPDEAEREIFGTRAAFSRRWAQKYGLPEELTAEELRGTGITSSFAPEEAFSEVIDTGFSDPTVYTRIGAAISASPNPNFKKAARIGLINSIFVNQTMKISRLAEVSQAMAGEHGLQPEGIALWLGLDQETRRALTLLFRLQGYEVADEIARDGTVIHDEIPELIQEPTLVRKKGKDGKYTEEVRTYSRLDRTEHRFNDIGNGEVWVTYPKRNIATGNVETVKEKADLDIRSDEIKKYLEAVQKAITVEGGVTTDPGIVRIAYTIFRAFGFAHENAKYAEDLIGKYAIIPYERKDALTRYFRRQGAREGVDIVSRIPGIKEKFVEAGELEPEEVAPYIEVFKDPESGKTLEEILKEQGVLGFALAVRRLPSAQIYREWQDTNRKLDLMDIISDMRNGTGGAAVLPVSERLSSITKLEDYGILLAKRKFSDATFQRIMDHSRVSKAPAAGQRGFWGQQKADMESLVGLIPWLRPKKPSVKGDRREHEGLDPSDFGPTV